MHFTIATLLAAPALSVRPGKFFSDAAWSPEPAPTGPTWVKSPSYRVCRDPENCGMYGTAGRCRDAFCAGCSSGPCKTLQEAQTCCANANNCSAVYGGGEHWWTFNGECEQVEHPNYYNVWQFESDGPIPTPSPTLPPTPLPTPESSQDFPAGLIKCNAGPPALKTDCSLDLASLNIKIRQQVQAHYDTLPTYCDTLHCPRGDLAGCLVRLVGHDIMDYNPALDTGGADGCIDFNDHDNLGLKGCMLEAVHERDSSNVSLESMWQEFCTQVSAADFFVITAEALMEATLPAEHKAAWGDLFRQKFQFGRRTQTSCAPEPLPNPTFSCDVVQDVFIDRMGLSWREATALMGVHTLGRALPENSGYDGFWVSHEHAKRFSNEYFVRIIATGWFREQTSKGKWQWGRADGKLQGEMMLNTDMCLAFQSGSVPPFTRAEDTNLTNCCLWLDRGHESLSGVECNCQARSLSEGCTLGNCCVLATGHCSGSNPFRRHIRNRNHAESFDAVSAYAKTNTGMDAWLVDFMQAWPRTTTQGHELDLC